MDNFDKLIQWLPFLQYYPRWVQFIFWMTLIFAMLTLFLLLFFSDPAKKAKKQVALIEFRTGPPFVDHEVLRDDSAKKSWTVYYFCVRIINNSYESAIRVQHLEISDLEIITGPSDTWQDMGAFTVDWDRSKLRTIPPRGKVLARFARVYPPDLQEIEDKDWSPPYDIPQLRFISFEDKGRMTRKMISKVPEGTHRFMLTAYFDNAPPASARFELTCPPEKGRTTAEALVKKIAIKMLKAEE